MGDEPSDANKNNYSGSSSEINSSHPTKPQPAEDGSALRESIIDFCDQWDRIILADGHEAAFIGVIDYSVANDTPRAVYDWGKVIEGLQRDGMTHEEAIEFFSYNVGGAYVGPETPLYLVRFDGA